LQMVMRALNGFALVVDNCCAPQLRCAAALRQSGRLLG
jgi:hypothetical protein